MKTFLELSLVSITLRLALFLKLFEKILALSLYWLSAQQETSTLTQKNFSSFYVNFSAEFIKTTFFYKSKRKGLKNG